MHKHNYDKLMKVLQNAGYTVLKSVQCEYKSLHISFPQYTDYMVSGKGITACFCTPNKQTYRQLSGKITADNEKCFDKWSKCPVSMKVEGINYDILLEQLEYLGSEEGFLKSDSFNYEGFIYQKD